MRNEKTIEVLKAATQDIRADYVARYTELELAGLVADRAGLAAVGMDMEIYSPYPSSWGISRSSYRQAEAKRNRVRASFQAVKCTHMPKEPCIVVERTEAEPRLRAAAKAAAECLVDKYLFKLAGKIDKTIVSATTNGRIWDRATLTVTCEDGEIQIWKTSCILNRSVYGKIFNQWPTHRLS